MGHTGSTPCSTTMTVFLQLIRNKLVTHQNDGFSIIMSQIADDINGRETRLVKSGRCDETAEIGQMFHISDYEAAQCIIQKMHELVQKSAADFHSFAITRSGSRKVYARMGILRCGAEYMLLTLRNNELIEERMDHAEAIQTVNTYFKHVFPFAYPESYLSTVFDEEIKFKRIRAIVMSFDLTILAEKALKGSGEKKDN